MSTKIFDAWRSVRPVRSLRELQRLSDAIRAQLEPISRRVFFRKCAFEVCAHIDGHLAAGKPMTESPGSAMWNAYYKAFEELKKGYRSPLWDASATWTFIIQSSGHVLLKVYAEHSITEQFKPGPLWRDFHYQNSTDRPEGVSARDWENRRRAWDRALLRSTPGQRGFTVSLWGDVNGPSPADRGQILRHQPRFRRRVDLATHDRTLHRYFQRHPLKAQPGNTAVPWFEAMERFRGWLETPNGQRSFFAERRRVLRILPRRVTDAMLSTTTPP